MVLLVIALLGAWFTTASGFSAETVAAFRIILVLAVAAVIITGIVNPMKELDANISSKLESGQKISAVA